MTTTPCTGCVVQQGTHQPAEALHQIAEPDAQHLQELAAYRFTVENLRARVAELDAQLAAAPQGVPVAWRYQTPTGWHATTDADSAIRVNAHHTIEPLYTHPTQQGLELHPNDVIRLAGEVGINVHRGDGWPDEQLIAKLVKFAAQAKQGGEHA